MLGASVNLFTNAVIMVRYRTHGDKVIVLFLRIRLEGFTIINSVLDLQNFQTNDKKENMVIAFTCLKTLVSDICRTLYYGTENKIYNSF